MKNNFIGLDGFIWFIGVVEDRQDPYLIGRVRVRCFGHHTGDKVKLPTEDLPWAQVMLPVTSAGISGVGQSPIGLVEGSHVFGFFRDGEARQEPVVMGSMPGYPTELGDPTKGFYSPIKGSDDPHAPDYLTNESSHPRWKDSPDNSQLATQDDYSFNPDLSKHISVTVDTSFIDSNLKNIGTAIVEPMQLASAFISKGSSSLFGFVADIITSQVASALGSNILNTVGGSLSGFTESISDGLSAVTGVSTSVVDGVTATTLDNTAVLSPVGKVFLNSKAGITNALLPSTVIKTLGDTNGILKVDILSPIDIAADTATDLGLSFVGIDAETGLFDFNVSNVDTLREIVSAPATADSINLFQQAEATLATASRGVTPQDLGVRPALGLVETVTNQSQSALEGASQIASSATGGIGDLIRVTDNVTGVIGDNQIVTAIVDDEFQDSLSASGRFAGSAGIPQKNALTLSGKTKLMNTFLGNNGGVADSFSVPTLPEVSEVYPYRHVYESESGHIMIYDDTPENESIIQRHKSGTQYSIAPDGTKTDIVVSDHIHAVTGSQYKVTTEDEICSIDGRCKLFINKSEVRNNHYDIVIGKGANVNIQVEQGDINMNAIDGRINMNCAEDFNIICGGEMNIISKGDFSVNSGDDITLQGDKIFLN